MTETTLERLRRATGPAHAQMEERVDLLGRPWTLDFYSALLGRFHGFYARAEPAIAARPEWNAHGFDIARRAKLGLLRRDLEGLGLSSGAVDALPVCENAPAPCHFAGALGCAYVLEGATLGGQVITRHLRRELGLSDGQGSAFFSSYGAEVGPMWREFTAFLNARALSPAEQEALIGNARGTFEALGDWLSDIL